ncbi:MAG: hypothetical protein ABEJ27_07220 [Halodesulfurarchaeum sp.]
MTERPVLDRFWTATAWHAVANERAYTAPAEPGRLLRVDPTRVRRYTGSLRLDVGLGRVQGGAWDRPEQCQDIRETSIYQGLEQRFVEGRDWEETVLFETVSRRFDEGERVRGYEDPEAFKETRCAYLDDLYQSMRTDGYRPNRTAAHDNPAAEENAYEDAYAHHLEPMVAIGRTGELILTEGYHRFGIADILNIDMAVQVLCRHRGWQAVRDAIADGTSDEPLADLGVQPDHPDLGDLALG